MVEPCLSGAAGAAATESRQIPRPKEALDTAAVAVSAMSRVLA